MKKKDHSSILLLSEPGNITIKIFNPFTVEPPGYTVAYHANSQHKGIKRFQ